MREVKDDLELLLWLLLVFAVVVVVDAFVVVVVFGVSSWRDACLTETAVHSDVSSLFFFFYSFIHLLSSPNKLYKFICTNVSVCVQKTNKQTDRRHPLRLIRFG